MHGYCAVWMHKLALSLLISTVVACTAASRPRPSIQPPTSAPTASPTASALAVALPASPPPADLGPPEGDPPPLGEVVLDEVSAPLGGPAILYGSAFGASRPNAPGRGGALLVAIDTPYQVFGRSASYVHVAAWHDDGQPAAGARVYVNRRGVGRTDASGALVFAHQPDKAVDDASWQPTAIFAVDANQRCGAVSFQPYERTKTFSTDRLFVYTDRGVFQPGETMHTRVIGWRLTHDYAPLAGAEVEMLLSDDSGHSIAAASGRTDDLGITAVDLIVPVTAAMGDYRLRVAYGNERASTRLQIRRFDPPAFRMQHTLGRFLLRNRRGALELSVTMQPPAAETLGRVDLVVTATAPGGKVSAQTKRSVRGNGPHSVSLTEADARKLIDATKEGELARIHIRARDELGREVEVTRELRVTAQPYVGVLELDRDEYATGDPVAVVARLSDRDSVPVRNTQVDLKVAGKSLAATTDGAGMARFSLPMPAADTALELWLGGVKVADAIVSWTTPLPMRTELGSPVILERRKTTVKARFPAGFEPLGKGVHMDMTDTSGGIVGSKVLPITKDAQGYLAQGELQAPSWGSMLLTFFALGRPKNDKTDIGLLVSGQSLVVQTDRELEIVLEGLPDKARPGDALSVRAHVRTPQGEAPEVSVGAALVDRSVLALKDPLEITPMDRFYNPELRTLATTGSKILTWPVVSRNFGAGDRTDVALPPWAWLKGGDVDSCRAFWDEDDWKAAGETPPSVGGFGSGQGFGSGHGALGTSHKTLITIRTRFPTTALWEPHLRGRGDVDIRGRLPDRIGEQELIVVASDNKGGVGVARRAIEVTQPVFVQADIPSPAIAGESIQIPAVVHNHTKSAAKFTVELSAGAGSHEGEVDVAAGGTGAVDLPLTVARPGSAQISVRAQGAGHDDRVLRDIVVAPRGIPLVQVKHAILTGGKPLDLDLSVAKRATGADAHLRIELPAITSGFARLPELAASLSDDPWRLAGDLASAALVLQMASRIGVDNDELTDLRGRLVAALALARRVQRSDGGFAYWRNGKASAFVTGRVLDGMLEARSAGLPLPAQPIARAAQFIAAPLAGGQLVAVSDIAWWEGDSTRVREGITAELFDVLSRLPPKERQGDVPKALDALTVRYQAYLGQANLDPLAAGRAVTALLRLGKIESAEAARVVSTLIALRDEGHWEPSWFHAYGGRVDTTLAVLQALQLVSPAGRQADKRDALSWILSTRGSWGQWHSEAATAAALRAMYLVGAAPEEIASTLVVRLDGKEVATVVVDPKDPWKSASALAHLDLGSLSPEKHSVQIDYSGKLKPAVSLVSRQWRTGVTAKVERDGSELTASGPSAVKAGSRLGLLVTAKGAGLAGGTVLIGRSGLLELDLGKLGTMVGRGRPIADVRTGDGGVSLTIAPDAKALSLSLPFIAARRGSGHLPTIGLAPHRARQPLIVDPGTIVVQ